MKYLWQAFLKSSYSLKPAKGFTLVEAMVTVLLFSLILGACLGILLSGSDSWQVNGVAVELQQELRKTMDWMKEDLVEGGVSTIPTPPAVGSVPADDNWYTTVVFKTSNGVSSGGSIIWSTDTIQFLRAGSDGNQLIRRSGGTDKVIAQDITSLLIRRQVATPTVVEVALEAQKDTLKGTTVTADMDFQIKLRN